MSAVPDNRDTAREWLRNFDNFTDASLPGCIASDVHNKIDRRTDVIANDLACPLRAVLQHQRFNAAECLACAVGMTRRHRARVTGIQCCKHVDYFGAANFANNQAVGAKAKRSAYEIGH